MKHVDIIKANLPDGSIWEIEDESDLDKFLEGIGDSLDEDKNFLSTLADIRNPLKTAQLEDLEKEFGISTNSLLTELERRTRLLGEKTDNNSSATHEWLEDVLQKRGFTTVFVHPNSPPVDPRIFLNDIGSTYCDGDTAYCDHERAVCGGLSGELVVNGELAGAEEFEIPDESGYWGLIFFVGGAAVQVESSLLIDELDDFLIDESGNFLESVLAPDGLFAIESAEIDASRKEELRREILKYKPMFSWCVLLAYYT